MSASKQVILTCDWDGCLAKVRYLASDINAARAAANKQKGWIRKQGSKDYCRSHAGFAEGGQTGESA
jgi:hypothetical protein